MVVSHMPASNPDSSMIATGIVPRRGARYRYGNLENGPIAATTGGRRPFSPNPFDRSRHYYVICALLAAWWTAYLYPLAATDDIVSSLMSAGDATASGSIYTQLLVICWAAFGVIHLPRAVRALRSRQSKTLLTLLALYLCWAALSTVWSEDKALTARRLIALLCLLVGGLGLGAGFYSRTRDSIATIARHVLYAAGIAVTLLFFLRLSKGSLMDLIDPQWSLKSTTQITIYAYPVAFAIVAAIFLFRKRFVLRLFVGGLFFLILIILKGRTIIIDVASAAGLVYARTTRFRTVRVVVFAISCVLAAFLADLMTAGQFIMQPIVNTSDAVATWMPYLSIGDGLRNLMSLSGRLPLWEALLRYAGERPYVGYGFGAFWSPSRFSEILDLVKWRAVVAHNGFLDEILATGVIGLALFLAFWIYGMYLSVKVGKAGHLVFGWLLLFLYLNVMGSILQSFFYFPTLITLVALGAVMDQCAMRSDFRGVHFLSQRCPADVKVAGRRA